MSEVAIYLVKGIKCYVGQTKRGVYCRWLEHIRSSKNPKKNKLHLAINKSGEQDFTIEVIDICAKGSADDYETTYISKLDSFRNGYNGNKGQGNIIDIPPINGRRTKIANLNLELQLKLMERTKRTEASRNKNQHLQVLHQVSCPSTQPITTQSRTGIISKIIKTIKSIFSR